MRIELSPLATSAVVLSTVLSATPAAAAPVQVAPHEWVGVDRVVAVGDLHGSTDKLVELLEAAGLIDFELRWTGGDDHLVVAGDILDRGRDERRLIDLLWRLQEESGQAGGRVHVLLGNHEVMNLLRDTRYVNPSAVRDYADDESEQERVAALKSFNPDGVVSTRRAGDLTAFNRRFPPGYFARQRAFDPDGPIGSWLLELPAMVKIDEVVYVHGGLSEEFAALGVTGINERVREQLQRHLDARELLQEVGVVAPTMRLSEVQAAAEKALQRLGGRRASEIRQASAALIAATESPILGARGPLWYRGNSFEDERIEVRSVEAALEQLGARALVVAHSPTGGRITSRFHGRLFRLDHDIRRSNHPLALVAEQGRMLVLDSASGRTSVPDRELPSGSVAWPHEPLPDRPLEEFLTRAAVVEDSPFAKPLGSYGRIVVLERDGVQRRAVFKTVAETPEAAGAIAEHWRHEIAAYRLDRLLDLGLVPVTVSRRIDGQQGSLQAFVERAVDRGTAAAYGLSHFDNVTADEKLERGVVFDALLDNRERSPSDVIFLLQGGTVFLVDHARTFSLSSEPAEAGKLPELDEELASELRRLDRETVERELGDLLSDRQLAALLARRDVILERVGPVAAPTAVAVGSGSRPPEP